MIFSVSYKKKRRARNILVIVLVIGLALAILKLIAVWNKVSAYHEAAGLQEQGLLVESEPLYQAAARNRSVAYREAETAQALADLKPVIEMKERVQRVIDRLDEEAESSNIDGLLAAYQAYQDLAASQMASAATAGLYRDIAEYLEIEEKFADRFMKVKNDYVQHITKSIKDAAFGQEAAIAALLMIPPVYSGGELIHNPELLTLLQSYDEAKLDAHIAANDLTAVLQEGASIEAQYRERASEIPWLMEKIDAYVIQTFTAQLDRGEVAEAIATRTQYRKDLGELAAPTSKANQHMTASLDGQLNAARQLVAAKQYQEGIALFEKLASYKDTKANITDAYKKMYANNPLQLLQTSFPGVSFASVENFYSVSGYSVLSFAVSGKTAYAAGLQSDASIKSASSTLSRSMSVKSIKLEDRLASGKDPVFFIDASSSQRKHRYIAMQFSGKALRNLLDAEADSYSFEGGSSLILTNSTGSGAGEMAYYTLKNGTYSFSKIKPDYIEIKASDIPKHIGKKVRFQTSIIAVDAGSAVAQLGSEYIILTGKVPFQIGSTSIIGTITGTSSVKSGARSITSYEVKVTRLQ